MKINHVAIIMDGNGRWAKEQKKPRIFGHARGIKVISSIIQYALESKINYLTLFAFSTENWNRPKIEVKFIVDSFYKKVVAKTTLEFFNKNGIRFKWLGFKNKISKKLLTAISKLEKSTKNNKNLNLTIAFNYGSRQEIEQKKLLSNFLPDVDLLIRTGGEKRISNFLLYQLAYAEIIFEPTYWPAYDKVNWEYNLNEYSKRDRRYGSIEK